MRNKAPRTIPADVLAKFGPLVLGYDGARVPPDRGEYDPERFPGLKKRALIHIENSVGSVVEMTGSDDIEIVGDQVDVTVVHRGDDGTTIEARLERRATAAGMATVLSYQHCARLTATLNRIDKNFEETDALGSLCDGWNNRQIEQFEASEPQMGGVVLYEETHQSDTRHFEDGYISSLALNDKIPVQVTHLFPQLRAELGQNGYVLDYDLAALRERVQDAIRHKSHYETEVRARTLLAVYTPVIIGDEFVATLRREPVNAMGYREVWLCVSGEVGYPLLAAD